MHGYIHVTIYYFSLEQNNKTNTVIKTINTYTVSHVNFEQYEEIKHINEDSIYVYFEVSYMPEN